MRPSPRPAAAAALIAVALTAAACGLGPRIEARPQSIAFAPAPTPAVNQDTVTVVATATSGLPVRYASATPATCAVDAASGVVVASSGGTCTVTASQGGDATWAAAFPASQDVVFTFRGVVRFGPVPAMRVFDLATVTATESAGLPVSFAGTTPSTCGVETSTGLVTALSAGDCTVVAAAGQARASLTFAISPPSTPLPPDAPSGVVATAGAQAGTVEVRVGGVEAGGSALTGFAVASVPAGLAATGATLPVHVSCGGSCSGYRFVVTATSAAGTGPASAPGDVVTRYRVLAVFHEPDTLPNDSIFDGTFTFNASTGTVTGLAGRLSEPMTGGPVGYPFDTMTWIALDHQLSAVPVTLGGVPGWLVATFRLATTDTLTSDPRFGGTDGWSPGTGQGLHSGFPGANPGNAYALVFVNGAEPAGEAAQAQIDRVAYADCAPGGMMGASCMTGTSVAGYGTVGSMGGYPLSQVTARLP